jgi:hypothetical protein
LIVVAVAIAFGCREIAILVVIFNGGWRRLFPAAGFGRFALVGLLAGSTHDPYSRDFDLNLTAIGGYNSRQNRNLHCLFPPSGLKRAEDRKAIRQTGVKSEKA